MLPVAGEQAGPTDSEAMPGDRCSVAVGEEAINETSVVDLSITEPSSTPGEDVLEVSLSAE